MKAHFEICTTGSTEISEEKIARVVESYNNSLSNLHALETLHIAKIKPRLNTKDEYRSRALTHRIY